MTDKTLIDLIARLEIYIKECPNKNAKAELIRTQQFFKRKLD